MQQCDQCRRNLEPEFFGVDAIYGLPKKACVFCSKRQRLPRELYRRRRKRPPGGAKVSTRRRRIDLIAERVRARE